DIARPCIGKSVACGPIDDLVRADVGALRRAGCVREYLHVLPELEEFLPGMEDVPACRVHDIDAGSECDDAKGSAQRIDEAREVRRQVVARTGVRDEIRFRRCVRICLVHKRARISMSRAVASATVAAWI